MKPAVTRRRARRACRPKRWMRPTLPSGPRSYRGGCALVDDQRADDDVSKDLTGGQNLEAARGVHVALNAATDDHVAAGDVAFDAAALADRQVASVVRSPFISPSNRMLDVDCSRPSSLI